MMAGHIEWGRDHVDFYREGPSLCFFPSQKRNISDISQTLGYPKQDGKQKEGVCEFQEHATHY